MVYAGRTGLVASAALVASATQAAAHHVMDGRMPTGWLEGLLSGLGHPVIGVDHLVAVLAVGALAALPRNGAWLATGYVLALVLGAAVHVGGADLPYAERLVAASLLVLGALLLWRRPQALSVLAGLFALTGALHGYALGESIVGAEPAPLASYFIGFAAIQSALAVAAMLAVRRFLEPAERHPVPLRLAGACTVVVGAMALVTQFGGAA